MTPEEAATIADCKNCPFAKNGLPPHKPVLAEIPSQKPIAMLIGEGPGESEVREGKPFVGSTGQELDRQLARASIPRHKLVIANATACRPPPGKTDNMLGRATKCCAPLFKRLTGDYQALPKLAAGKWAAYTITGKATGVDNARGFLRDNNLIITYHPTYAFFRNPWVKGDFEIDLHRFRRLIDNRLQDAPTVVLEPTEEHMSRLLSSIKANNNFVAVDIETGAAKDAHPSTGKDATRSTLKTIAFGTDMYAVAMIWPVHNGGWQRVKALLLNPTICKVFHNGIFFDLRVMARYGIEVINTMDTREMRRALVSTSALSLRYLAQTYCDGFPPWKELEDEK